RPKQRTNPMTDLYLTLDRDQPRLADQLAAGLRESIGDGRLRAGTRLPSSRDLAAQLGVSRGRVVQAYEQLVAEGWLVARRGAGTVVAPLPAGDPAPAGARPRRRPPAPLRPGVPDLGKFPRATWRRAYEQALRTADDADLDYGDPAGPARLREQLAGYLGRVRSARVHASDLVVTTGAAQAIALLARVLRAGGRDRIGVEDPGSRVIRDHLRDNGLRPVPVPVDGQGVDVAALARGDVHAVLVTPSHQYPTGV